jgi:hypothetical protein
MRYYAAYKDDGTLLCIGTADGDGMVRGEITKEEYDRLKAELEADIPEPEDTADPEVEEALAILRGEVTE